MKLVMYIYGKDAGDKRILEELLGTGVETIVTDNFECLPTAKDFDLKVIALLSPFERVPGSGYIVSARGEILHEINRGSPGTKE